MLSFLLVMNYSSSVIIVGRARGYLVTHNLKKNKYFFLLKKKYFFFAIFSIAVHLSSDRLEALIIEI